MRVKIMSTSKVQSEVKVYDTEVIRADGLNNVNETKPMEEKISLEEIAKSIEAEKKSSGNCKKLNMKKGFRKTDLVTLMAMAAFIGFSVSIAGGFYKFMIGGNQELFDEQEKEYLLLAEKQVKLLEVINSDSHLLETSALNKTTENLTEEVKINSRMIEKQNRTFIEVETSLDEVEEESESMSEEYNYNLEELVEVQKEHNQTFNEHKQKVEKVVNEMNALNNSVQQELDSQKAEYSELFGQQEENLKNRSKNTEKEQESSKDKLLEKVEEQKNTIDSLNEKQSSLEASLNETQEDIDSQSQQINDLNNSVDDIEDDIP